MFDWAIRGGTVIDGTGKPGRQADLGIQADRITRIGPIEPAEARHVVEAAGRVVAPGLIDVHNHSEGWLLKSACFAPKVSQGFTTEILMSDGISYAPVTEENWRDWFVYLRSLNGLQLEDYRGWRSIADYLALLNGRTAQNVAALIPYANVRVLAQGWRRDVPDDTQMRIIRREIERAMAAGAVGLSTGLDYIAECFATTDELIEACSAMAPWQGVYVTHVRYKKGTLRGVQEAVEIGRRARVPVHISHLKAGSPQELDELLGYIDRVAVNEVDFSFDVYPYMPGSTMLNFLLPYDVWEQGPLGVLPRLREPATRDRMNTLLQVFTPSWDRIRLAWFATKANGAYQGSTLGEYLRQTQKTPADAICDLLYEESLAGLAVIFGDDGEGHDPVERERLIEPMLAHSRFMLGSDGIWFADGLVHPRVYGSASRILGPLVRERRLFSLEAAVQHMTSVPAARFQLADRGTLREGAAADVIVFDPATITDRATYAVPHQLSIGMDLVIVNGQPVWRAGQPTDQTPGRALSTAH